MHIADGILDAKLCVGGYIGASALVGYALHKIEKDEISKVSVMSAVFFVSSLIHFKIGISSVHLLFIGLIGISLGKRAPIAILTGLFFQAIMFGHGGMTTLGINTLLFSIPALLVASMYHLSTKWVKKIALQGIISGILSALAIILSSVLLLIVIHFTSKHLQGLAIIFSASHIGLAVVEGILNGIIISQLLRLKPEMVTA